MGQPEEVTRREPIILHVITLGAMTTLTNASALMPSTFGVRATMALATLTLVLAAMESTVAGWSRSRGETPPEAARDLHRLHVWSCALAALVSVTCAGFAVLSA
jgi:hypothetical protein